MRNATAASETVRAMIAEASRVVEGPARRLLREIADQHGVSVSDIIGWSRKPKIVSARWHACFELRCTGKTLPAIGRLLKKDHTSVLYGCRNWPARAAQLGIAVGDRQEAA